MKEEGRGGERRGGREGERGGGERGRQEGLSFSLLGRREEEERGRSIFRGGTDGGGEEGVIQSCFSFSRFCFFHYHLFMLHFVLKTISWNVFCFFFFFILDCVCFFISCHFVTFAFFSKEIFRDEFLRFLEFCILNCVFPFRVFSSSTEGGGRREKNHQKWEEGRGRTNTVTRKGGGIDVSVISLIRGNTTPQKEEGREKFLSFFWLVLCLPSTLFGGGAFLPLSCCCLSTSLLLGCGAFPSPPIGVASSFVRSCCDLPLSFCLSFLFQVFLFSLKLKTTYPTGRLIDALIN